MAIHNVKRALSTVIVLDYKILMRAIGRRDSTLVQMTK